MDAVKLPGLMSSFLKRLWSRRIFRVATWTGLACGVLMLCLVAWAQVRVGAVSDRVVDDLAAVEAKSVCLLLGTSKAHYGRPNLYFLSRIDAAARLYAAGKVRCILVSGDNSRKDYDEPGDMRAALVAKGVPESAIRLDCAGFDTLDSVVRAKRVFGADDFIVVSQRFHCERAVYIADNYGIKASGYACAEPRVGLFRWRIRIRECLARVKALLEAEVLHPDPQFLGNNPYGPFDAPAGPQSVGAPRSGG